MTKALTAIDPGNAELAAARDLEIPLEPWQQVVADAAAGRRLIGIAGTHGKSTSAGWLVHVLAAAGRDPGAFVGALLPASLTGFGVAATARRGAGDTFVVEADEYAGNFDAYRPSVIVLTSAEWDHPDVFADRAAVLAAFERWIRRAAEPATGDGRPPGPGRERRRRGRGRARRAAGRLARADRGHARWSTWRRSAWAATRAGIADRFAQRRRTGRARCSAGSSATDPEATTLELAGLDPLAGPTRVRLPTAGRHNAANALGVAGAAAAVGAGARADRDRPRRVRRRRAAPRAQGRGRRASRCTTTTATIPTAIRETLAAVRQREPGRRVWAVYEPLTYHRTAALLDAFADALAAADAVAIADIWAGRDPDTSISSASGLAAAVAARNPSIPVAAPGSVEATAAWLAGEVRRGDAVLVMGGGRSYRIGELLLEHLEAR